jgi:uroporphyrin-3 C-methyltransferase
MTEQKNPSAKVDETYTAVESPQQPDTASRETVQKERRTGPVLGAIAIVLVIALGAGIYYHGHQQAQAEASANEALQAQLAELKNSQQQDKQQIDSLLDQQTSRPPSAVS